MQTKLSAVNYLLDVLGSPPISDLTVLHPDVATCLNKLEDSSMYVQSIGYWFNTDIGVELQPSSINSEIDLPVDTAKVLAIYGDFVIQRGTKLYSTINQSYQFLEPIVIDVIRILEWDYLPLSVQNAIKYHAAMQVASIDLEDSNKAREQGLLYQEFAIQIKAEDLELTRRNVLTGPAVSRYRNTARPYKTRSSVYNPMYPGG